MGVVSDAPDTVDPQSTRPPIRRRAAAERVRRGIDAAQVLAARASLAGRAVPARASRVERMATRPTAFTVSASGSATVGKGQGDLEMVREPPCAGCPEHCALKPSATFFARCSLLRAVLHSA